MASSAQIAQPIVYNNIMAKRLYNYTHILRVYYIMVLLELAKFYYNNSPRRHKKITVSALLIQRNLPRGKHSLILFPTLTNTSLV